MDASYRQMEDFNKQGNIKFIGKDEADKDGIPDLNNIVALLNEYSSDPRWLHFDIAFALREGQRKKKKKKRKEKYVRLGVLFLAGRKNRSLCFLYMIYIFAQPQDGGTLRSGKDGCLSKAQVLVAQLAKRHSAVGTGVPGLSSKEERGPSALPAPAGNRRPSNGKNWHGHFKLHL